MRQESTQFYIPVLLAIAVAAGLAYYWLQINKSEAPVQPVPPRAGAGSVPDEPVSPLHPFPIVRSPEEPSGELIALPPLDQSDEYLKLELAAVLGSRAVADMLAEADLIAKIVATVDSLPRDHVAGRIRPVAGLADAFDVDAAGNDEFEINAASYRRYDALVGMITGADLNELAEVYGRFYPLFQKAYENLGYPNAFFNDRLVFVIDHLLATPEVKAPVRVVRPHVLYEFADMDLESLSSGQKLLIRMGSDNAARIKATLKECRLLIANDG